MKKRDGLKLNRKKSTPRNGSRILSTCALLLAVPSLGISSCGTTPPAIEAKQWLGYSAGASVVSSQGEQVQCAAPEFDRFACYTLEDLKRIWTTVYGCCERWRPACVTTGVKGGSP